MTSEGIILSWSKSVSIQAEFRCNQNRNFQTSADPGGELEAVPGWMTKDRLQLMCPKVMVTLRWVSLGLVENSWKMTSKRGGRNLKEFNQNHNRHLPGIPDQEVHECPGNEVLARISSELLSLQLLCLMLSMFYVQKENRVMSVVDERCCLPFQ